MATDTRRAAPPPAPPPHRAPPPAAHTPPPPPPDTVAVAVAIPKVSPPKAAATKAVTSPPPPVSTFKIRRDSDENSVAARASRIEAACSPPTNVASPPLPPPPVKVTSADAKETPPPVPKVTRADGAPPRVPRRENSLCKDDATKKDNSLGNKVVIQIPGKVEKPPAAAVAASEPVEVKSTTSTVAEIKNSEVDADAKTKPEEAGDKTTKGEESNGVGDKIKKFEKAAEDASGGARPVVRTGSLRARARDAPRASPAAKDDFPPPATPFKDNVHFDLPPVDRPDSTPPAPAATTASAPDRPPGIMKNTVRWQRSDSNEDKPPRPEPQKIIKPEFKAMPTPADATIRSPSLGAKPPDQFPSSGTAFRNVASPDRPRAAAPVVKFADEPKQKPKEKYSVSKGSSYFTRGSEEIWLVKKKDIEEIEERVLDSFRRAGGTLCARADAPRPASDAGGFTHATMGRTKRHAYARSESLDPQWAGARAHTLKRQTSVAVACTCGHDKKPGRSGGRAPPPLATPGGTASTPPRPRSRSHGDDAAQAHVLDKYETLV